MIPGALQSIESRWPRIGPRASVWSQTVARTPGATCHRLRITAVASPRYDGGTGRATAPVRPSLVWGTPWVPITVPGSAPPAHRWVAGCREAALGAASARGGSAAATGARSARRHASALTGTSEGEGRTAPG